MEPKSNPQFVWGCTVVLPKVFCLAELVKAARAAAIRSVVPGKPKVPKRRWKEAFNDGERGLGQQEIEMPSVWISGDKASPDILLAQRDIATGGVSSWTEAPSVLSVFSPCFCKESIAREA